MKSFKQYLKESVQEHVFALRLVAQPTENQLATIHTYLQKYDLVSIDAPENLQDKLDFFANPHKDVWQIRFVTGMPMSSYILMQELKSALDIPEDYIVVRASNEPVELQLDDCEFDCEVEDIKKSKDLTTAAMLSTDRFYDDAEQPLVVDVFGDAYNKKLLDYLRSVSDERPTEEYEAPAPLFSWIDMNKVMADQAVEPTDFNAQFDTPKPVNAGKGTTTPPIEPIRLGSHGSFDDGAAVKTALLKDKSGKREAVSAPRNRLSAGKE